MNQFLFAWQISKKTLCVDFSKINSKNIRTLTIMFPTEAFEDQTPMIKPRPVFPNQLPIKATMEGQPQDCARPLTAQIKALNG